MTQFMASRTQGDICLFGAPFDSTTSFRPGARFGPAAIREASYGLETFSPIQNADLEDCSFMDKGDLELPFGDPRPALTAIEEYTAGIIAQDKIPLMLGGEHLISLSSLRAASHVYKDIKLIHLDAHADLRDSYLGQKLSHATVMKRISEVIGLDAVRQIGIRSCTREEYPNVKRLRSDTKAIIGWASGSPCYITCDLDILDPSVLPGTGTPEPGGLSFSELIDILVPLISKLNVVCMDIVELSPRLDPSDVSSVVAAKILRECIIALNNNTD